MYKQPLTDADLKLLAASFVSPELAQSAGIFRVDTHEGAELVGRNGRGDYSGVVFPYFLPGSDNPREYRLRRDHPDLEQKPDGTLKEKGKYLSPPGRGNLLYFVPDTPPVWLQDTKLPVVITEGEKKTLALYRLAFHERQAARFMPVGLPGAWNWRGVVGKADDEMGARRDVKGPIPDLNLIKWSGRTTYIIFDVNTSTNESVQAARHNLAKELARRGASVRIVDLPQIGGINGVDDLLFARGPEYVLALIESAKPHEEEKPARKPQATVLVELAEDAELFQTPEGDAYATVTFNEHLETWPLKTRGFRDWLMRRFYEAKGSAPSSQTVQEALDVLHGRARFEGATHEVHTRIAEHAGMIYLDLCDEQWRVVCIAREGWRVLNHAPVKFRRAKGMLALPEPVAGGQASLLRDFLNVTADDWPLAIAWLVAAYRPGKPFPLLALHGEQGSAKSTTARVLRALVDPNKADLRSEPREVRDLMIAARNGWVISLDNLSHIPTWLSDALCRLATGGGFATRELYANDEEVLFEAKRPIILNGIEELATRSDLLERTVVLNQPAIPEDKRRTEAEFWQEFEAARPAILGALLDAVSGALRRNDSVRLGKLPRMADFAQWATAAEGSLGLPEGAFIAAYTGNREASNGIALEASPVAAAVLSFVEAEGRWTGEATELWEKLNARAGEDVRRQRGWPKAPNALSGALKRLAPNLRVAGVNFTRPNRAGKKGARLIQLERLSVSSSGPSEPSAASISQTDSPRPSDGLVDADDVAAESSGRAAIINASKNMPSDASDDSDGLSQGLSNSPYEYEPDEEEIIYEAEERAAIMGEGSTFA